MALSSEAMYFIITFSIFLITAIFHRSLGKLLAKYIFWFNQTAKSSRNQIGKSYYSVSEAVMTKKGIERYGTEKGERQAGITILILSLIMLVISTIGLIKIFS